ncbi:peptidylprolyl isomerase [Lentisphaera profundi]|uniref:Peptidyl-prolyl cis-trans isomerase n=1 Tax=Lentisphaera profundi TaxID=1658616 RepID=A0ABY7VX76_9BACT|nr:peptidylprolyl isomerase [Lentisphaera profundi]WDE98702.1 peptidylprolyl isomerase [Lentisphaera profundi]
MKYIKILIFFSLLVACGSNDKKTEAKEEVRSDKVSKKAIETYAHPVVKISTSKGVMIAELYEDKAPNTVANFVSLVESGYYQDMHFHRVIKGFMAQGGCPYSRTNDKSRKRPGTGGPGYSFNNETHPQLRHTQKGILSMANSGPHTNGSQFFMLFKESSFLNGSYNVFGRIIEGLDVLDKIEAIGAKKDGLPLKERVTFSITLIQKNDHPYKVIKNSNN